MVSMRVRAWSAIMSVVLRLKTFPQRMKRSFTDGPSSSSMSR